MNVTASEEFAFSLWLRECPEPYKRTLLETVYDTICSAGTITESRLCYDLQRQHGFLRPDIKSAISGLRSPRGFNAIHMWKAKVTGNTLLKAKQSPVYSEWVASHGPV